MTVAQLVQQPGREHLPYLTPFNRSGNGISAWINRMMYSNLSKGHPTFTNFPRENQETWFRQFASSTWNSDHTEFIREHFVRKVMDNYGKQIYDWKQKWLIDKADENDGEPVDDFVLMKMAHTNKKTGEIDDGVVKDVLSLIETQKEDEETRLSQFQTDPDATSTASTSLSRIRINEIVESSVPKKKGRLVGLGRRARSVPPSPPQPYVDPEGLMDQLKDKDDRIAALEPKIADQEAGWEATRKQNEQMMEMMRRMYPNEHFPFGNIPRKCIPRDIPTTASSDISRDASPRNFLTDKVPRNIPTALVSRKILTAVVRRNFPIPLFSRNVSED
ncbi:hypothetical protein IGI04_030378, partial [Brassica rapa subsp. trilocularis]